MNIEGVVSFSGAWDTLNSKHKNELDELITSLNNYVAGNTELVGDSDRRSYREYFEKSLYDLGWVLNDRTIYTDSGRRIPIRFIGPVKNGVAAQISSPSPDCLSRWLFNHSTLAIRHGVAEVAILLVPMRSEQDDKERAVLRSRINYFEYYADQLEMLSPLSVDHPFIILGYSSQDSLFGPSVLELARSEQFNSNAPESVVDRSIEFPPEYQQAGIGILNYFASYLNEEYPGENATVRIEQTGLKVRMVVESESGNKEVIEKALHEYELIVSGQERADKFTDSETLILELRNELRVAKFRLESQQDIISLQNINQKKSETHIDGLMNLLGNGLKPSGENHINVQVNPCIQNSVVVEINQDVSLALGNIEELLESLPKDSEALLPLKDLEQSLINLESEKDKDKVRRSSTMSKFHRIIDQLNDGNSIIKKAVDSAEQGYDVAKKLAGNYNKIASWCGLPSIPTVFTSET
jgi:hypothetical protein